MTTTIPKTPSVRSSDPNRKVLYELSGLMIGQKLIARERQATIRAIFAPNNLPRWRHLAEIVDATTQEVLPLETGSMVTLQPGPTEKPQRYWIKYQGKQIWVVYVYRFGSLQRYQGGNFKLLDTRPSGPVPIVPPGAIEVIGDYAERLNALLALCNDTRFLEGEELPEDFFEQLEPLATEWNELAARSFWHYNF